MAMQVNETYCDESTSKADAFHPILILITYIDGELWGCQMLFRVIFKTFFKIFRCLNICTLHPFSCVEKCP